MGTTIEGVLVTPLRVIPDERGWLMEILRCDDPHFSAFGQVYMTTAYPNVVKAWHYHKKQTDNFTCVHGMMKVALYDARPGSPTHGVLMEVFIGEKNPALITVPPGVYHGFKAIGNEKAIVANCATIPHDPTEIERLDPFDKRIGYSWDIRHG